MIIWLSDGPVKPMLRRDGEAVSKTNLWYQLGDSLKLDCLSLGGYPAPLLEWFEDHQLSERMIRSASNKYLLGSNLQYWFIS